MPDDAVFCPTCETKMKTVQGASFLHENQLLYWRRKKCLNCGWLQKTVEVPAENLPFFHTAPSSKEMS